jgi:hypothetical protein
MKAQFRRQESPASITKALVGVCCLPFCARPRLPGRMETAGTGSRVLLPRNRSRPRNTDTEYDVIIKNGHVIDGTGLSKVGHHLTRWRSSKCPEVVPNAPSTWLSPIALESVRPSANVRLSEMVRGARQGSHLAVNREIKIT